MVILDDAIREIVYFNLKIKAVKMVSGGNSKAFYDTKRFRFRFRFVSGARMYYFKILNLKI
jgi:hypothetical protein